MLAKLDHTETKRAGHVVARNMTNRVMLHAAAPARGYSDGAAVAQIGKPFRFDRLAAPMLTRPRSGASGDDARDTAGLITCEPPRSRRESARLGTGSDIFPKMGILIPIQIKTR